MYKTYYSNIIYVTYYCNYMGQANSKNAIYFLINIHEYELTAIKREMAVGHELSRFHSIAQRSHSPRTAEEHVSSGAQRAQLLHAPLLRAPILKPHLHDRKYTKEKGH